MIRILLLFWLLIQSASADTNSGRRYPVREGTKTGFIDGHGVLVIQAKFDEASGFTYGLSPVRIGEFWGYVADDGRIVIPPQFLHAYPFIRDSFAYVRDWSGHTRAISKTGEALADSQIEQPPLTAPSDELSIWEADDGMYGFANAKQEMVVPARYISVTEFSEGIAAVQEDKKLWGYIDASGAYVLEPRYDAAFPFQSGRAVVKLPDGYTLIGRQGEPLITQRFADLNDFFEGLAAAKKSEDGLWGYINEKGDFALPPRFDSAGAFLFGRAMVCEKSFCGLINPQGGIILPLRFANAAFQDENVLSAKLADSPYYFSKTGEEIYSPLNRRTLITLILYLLPFLLPVIAARVVVSRRISQLNSLSGEEFRILNFQTIRELGRIRSLHGLAFLALFFFTDATKYFSWLIPEALTAAISHSFPHLGFSNPFPQRSPALVWLNALSGLMFLVFLLLFTSGIIRGSWIRVEQQVFGSKMSARHFYGSLFRGQLIAIIPAILLIGLIATYPPLMKLGFGLTVVYIFLLAIVSPLVFALSNKRSKRKDPRLEAVAAELREASGISLAEILVVEEPTGRIMNAFATGMLPRYRRVFVTQALLERCDDQELKAIIAHELGHMKHHDVAKRVAVALIAIWLARQVVLFFESFEIVKDLPDGGTIFFWLLLGIPMISVIVGWRARKAEYRADRYAAGLVGSPALVMQALKKIHEESAIPRTFGRWQQLFLGHPSLHEREEALSRLRSQESEGAPGAALSE